MKFLITLSTMLCGAFLLTISGAEAVFPVIAQTPEIDGKVSADEYIGAGHAEFKRVVRGTVPKEKTEAWFARDDKNLYAAFICYDSDIKRLRRAWKTPEERDNAIWTDDCVEIRFDPWNSPDEPAGQRHIICNANAIFYDAIGQDKSRDFNVNARTFIGDDFWCVEIAVPLQELTGYESGGAELWRLMLGRNCPRTREYSTITGGKAASFAKPEHFLTFRSGKVDPARPFTVTGLVEGKFQWRSENGAAELSGKLEQLRLDGKVVGKKIFSTLKADKTSAELAFNRHKEARSLRFTAPGKYVLEWNLPIAKQESSEIRFTAKPLYKELWSDGKPGLAVNGSMVWSHGFDANIWQTAMEFAFPWNLYEAVATAGQYRLLIHQAGGHILPQWYGFGNSEHKRPKFVHSSQYYGYEGVKVPKADDGRPLLFDPQVEERWLQATIKHCKAYANEHYAISFGDEITEHWELRFFSIARKHRGKGTYPFLDEMCKTIKDQYGAGKFGPPESPADTNPFRWIAFRSYLNDQSVRMHKKLLAAMRKELPDVKLYADDPRAGQSKVYDFADFSSDFCDIVSHQLYPQRHRDLADFSFTSKYVRDMIQVKDFHPCFHIENYGSQYTPLEMLEKVSQGFRSGANGFHWYLYDTSGAHDGRSLRMDRYGAPERWNLLLALQDEVRNLPPLKYPEPDCGVFAPTITARAVAGLNLHPMTLQMFHSLLELQGGLWFKYFSENSLKRKLVDLNKFKVVFVPDAKYCSKESLAVLVEFARNGGTLVITDPEAFSFDAAAVALDRDQLPGLKMTARKRVRNLKVGNMTLPAIGVDCFNIRLSGNSKVLASYPDGKAAIVETPFGKGKVIVSGINFARRDLVTLEPWKKWSREFFKSQGLQLDRDIWRFRFPASLIAPEAAAITARCLTGNYIFFRNFRAYYGANSKVSPRASYSYTTAPDAPAESAKISLRQGKLTDRARAYRSGNINNKTVTLNDRVVGWSTDKGFAVEFDLAQKTDLGRVKIFYTGSMRDVTVYTSGDDGKYSKAGFFPANGDKITVGLAQKDLQLPVAVENVTRVKLEFAALDSVKPIYEKNKVPRFVKVFAAGINKLPITRANIILAEIELWDK